MGAFCHGCGAKAAGARDLSIRHFASELFQEVTSLEHSKILRTLGALLFRPGLLSAEYFSARRVRYVRPLALCLTIFALNLIVFSAGQEVSLFDVHRPTGQEREAVQRRNGSIEGLNATRIEAEAARRGVSVRSLQRSINERWAQNASLMQIPQILLMTLVLLLAHLFSHRYLAEHFVFSLHFISFQVLTTMMMWPIYYSFGLDPTPLMVLVTLAKIAVDTTYLFLGFRFFYSHSLKKALLRAPLVFIGYILVYSATQHAAMQLAINSLLRD